jgi:hypothetical protein
MRSLIFTLLAISLPQILNGQVIDDSSINNAQNDGYSFVEGRFVAYLADTVSPRFIEKYFQELGIPVLDIEIEPLVISLVNQPSDESIRALKNHPKILSVYTMVDKASSQRMEELLKQRGYSKEEIKRMKDDSPEMIMYMINFDYTVNERIAKEIMGDYRDVAYRILSRPLKTVTLKAKEGEEPLLMEKVEQLEFVEGTAMIGAIKN